MPTPDYSKIKSFSQLKYGAPRYGSGGVKKGENIHSKSFFNKGKVGQWRDVFDRNHSKLFWLFHGRAMEHFGYERNGQILPSDSNEDLEYNEKFQQKVLVKKLHEVRVLLRTGFRKTYRQLKSAT